MRRLVWTLCLLFAAACLCRSQPTAVAQQRCMLGGGFGFDQGGLGLRVDARITSSYGLFVGVGTNFGRFGYSLGVHARILPSARFCPYATAMYTSVADSYEPGSRFQGPSFGGGLEWRSRMRPHYFHIGALFLLSSAESREASANTGHSYQQLVPTFGWHFVFPGSKRQRAEPLMH